ncbi:MAG: hypothetical protein ABI972_29680 [Acidobacteriota bacterium]
MLDRLRNLGSSASGALFLVLIVGLPIWGIIHTFSRHGAALGCLAVVLPPYAAYEGVAVLWETPKWERVWNDNSEIAGAAVLKSLEDDTRPEQVAMKSFIKSWIGQIPESRRTALRADLDDLGHTFVHYWQNVMDDLAAGNDFRSMTDPSLGLASASFMQNSGLSRIWNRWVLQEKTTQQEIRDRFRGASRSELQKIAHSGTPESERLLAASLDEIFGEAGQ